MNAVNQNQLQVVNPNNLFIPAEGPKAIPLYLDFSLTPEYLLDLQQYQSRQFFSMVQTLFCDAAQMTKDVKIEISGIGQTIVIKAGTQGYYPVLCPNYVRLLFSSLGTELFKVQLINLPIAGVVWSAP